MEKISFHGGKKLLITGICAAAIVTSMCFVTYRLKKTEQLKLSTKQLLLLQEEVKRENQLAIDGEI